MSVFKRGKSLVIDYYPEGRKGKRKRITLGKNIPMEKAKIVEQSLRTARKNNSYNSKVSGQTINDLYPQYLTWFKLHKSESTLANLSGVYNNHLKRLLGHYKISDLNVHHVDAYKQYRRNECKQTDKTRKVSNRTISKELAYLSGFLTWCRKHVDGYDIKLNIEKLPYKSPLPDVLTHEEALSLIDNTEGQYKLLLLLILTLGLRSKEARTLKWTDIDFQAKSIKVKQKGGSYKILPLTDELFNMINSKERINIYVFPSQLSKGQPVRELRGVIKRACEKAGITKRVYPHLLRHSCGAHLVASGVDIRTIQEILGHKSIQTTQIYTQISIDIKRRALIKAGLYKGVSTEDNANKGT